MLESLAHLLFNHYTGIAGIGRSSGCSCGCCGCSLLFRLVLLECALLRLHGLRPDLRADDGSGASAVKRGVDGVNTRRCCRCSIQAPQRGEAKSQASIAPKVVAEAAEALLHYQLSTAEAILHYQSCRSKPALSELQKLSCTISCRS